MAGAGGGVSALLAMLMLLVGVVVGGTLFFMLHPPSPAGIVAETEWEEHGDPAGEIPGEVLPQDLAQFQPHSPPPEEAQQGVQVPRAPPPPPSKGDQLGDGIYEPGDEFSKALLDMPDVSYEQCLESLKGQSMAKKKNLIEWLHFPKCGSSFSTAVYTYLCQEEPSGAEFTSVKEHMQNCSKFCGPTAKAWDYYATKVLFR